MISSAQGPGRPAPSARRRLVCVVSGGLDSVTLAHVLAAEGHELVLVSFDYGQRHVRELEFARRAANRLGATHHVLDLAPLSVALSGSSLTDPDVEVPDGHYAAESMQATVVPNRNAIFLSIAVGLAVAQGADGVAYGAHGGDHFIYPDCRPAFVEAFSRAARLGNEGFVPDDFELLTPFLQATKADIVLAGDRVGVPFAETWSCYRGEEVHCGRCGTCTERIEAFELAGIADPTTYGARV